MAIVDCAAVPRTLQHRIPVASNNSPRKSAPLQGQPKRSANQASPDDRDLPNRHESITYRTWSQRTKQPMRREDLAWKMSGRGKRDQFQPFVVAFLAVSVSLCLKNGYPIFRPTAGAIRRNWSINFANCSGNSDCAPSDSARSGSQYTSLSRASAPAATDAPPMGATLSRRPVTCYETAVMCKCERM